MAKHNLTLIDSAILLKRTFFFSTSKVSKYYKFSKYYWCLDFVTCAMLKYIIYKTFFQYKCQNAQVFNITVWLNHVSSLLESKIKILLFKHLSQKSVHLLSAGIFPSTFLQWVNSSKNTILLFFHFWFWKTLESFSISFTYSSYSLI